MKTTLEFLDAIKYANGGISDYAVAKLLGVSQQTVSRYRTGRDFFSDSMSIKIAKLLDIDPAIVIAAIHAERAKAPEEKEAWERIWKKLGGLAASVVVGVSMLAPPSPAEASTSVSRDMTLYYVALYEEAGF